MLYKHASFKQVNVEEKRETLKPWVTTGIKTIIKVWGKLYQEMGKEKERVIREEQEKKFKKCRNN